MVLHAKGTSPRQFKALNGIIVKVKVTDTSIFWQTLLIHREAVILNGDLNFPRGEVLHRVISAAVSEFELVGLAAHHLAQDLVTKTDSKHGESS